MVNVEPYPDRPANGAEEHFIDRLSLRQVDRDIFTGWCHAGAPLRAFGGQVAAQALVAAGNTIDEEDRTVHSLHGYFLRPGRTSDHIVYLVDRPRDGRSFSTRRVRAVQYGETIFMMSASFSVPQRGPDHQVPPIRDPGRGWIDAVPSPDRIAGVDVFAQVDLDRSGSASDYARQLHEAGFPEHRLLDLRLVDEQSVREVSLGRADQMAWVRARERLPDSDLIQVCALTYFSDLTLVHTVLGHHGGREGTHGLQIASIDHAMWFHARFRADEWLLFVTQSPLSGHGHGFARGEFFRADGRLVASSAQEVLMREPPDG